MWENFQNFPPCGLQDFSVWIDKNPFLGLAKNKEDELHKVTFLWKNVTIGGDSLDSFFKASLLYAWKFSNLLKLSNI